MKKLQFETSKGRFLICDENLYLQNINEVKSAYFNSIKQFEYEYFIRLTNITEEQVSEIVDFTYNDYRIFGSAICKLHSLLKSKGIHLFRSPIKKHFESLEEWKEKESKTFYNPVIFKL